MNAHSLYVVLNYISVFVMLFSCIAIAMRPGSQMQKLALMVCMSLTVCCIGFLFRSEAVNAEAYMAGQKLVYAFVTHGMFIMLLFILNYCSFKLPKAVIVVCHFLNLLVSVSVITLDHHTLFYRSYRAVYMAGYCILEKEYGPLHTLAVALFAVYMISAVVITLVFSAKNIRTRTKYVWMLLAAVMVPCVAYIVPKVTHSNNDMQPVAFAVFMILVKIMIFRNKLYDVDDIAAKYTLASVAEALIVFDAGYTMKGWNAQAARLFPVLKHAVLDTDVRSFSPVLTDLLEGKASEYTSGGQNYRVSVRPVMDDDGRKNIGRVLWIEDNTLQKNYMRLLQKQKSSLEKEVVTLSGYSYTDDLTGLENRRAYEDRVTELRELGTVENVTVIAMDLNGLKEVNDSLGHSAGDELLRGAAEVITETFAPYGKTYRTGGDEFFVLINGPFTETETVLALFKRNTEKWHGDAVKTLSISIGIACGKDRPEVSIDELMKLADREMYANKREYYSGAGIDRRHR